jgi:hypothetical protein
MRVLRCSFEMSLTHWLVVYQKLFIGGDLNGHVGSIRVGFNGVYGGFRYGSRNQEGMVS